MSWKPIRFSCFPYGIDFAIDHAAYKCVCGDLGMSVGASSCFCEDFCRFMMGDIEIGSISEAAEHGLANTPNCLLLPVPTTGGLCASLPWFSSCFCMRNKSEAQLRD